jgi:hypothetical protein
MGKYTAIAQIIPRLVDEETAAHFLGRSRTRFREQVAAKLLPGPSDRNGNVNLWDLRLLDRYVDQKSGIDDTLSGWDR